jgi:hypothetical protein
VIALFVAFLYCLTCKYFKFSAAVLKTSCKIIRRHPSMLLLVMLDSVLEIGISVIYTLCFYGVVAALWSPWLYLYFLFSYFWVTLTIKYVVYMAVSGVFSTWYFLDDTEYYPSSPVSASFKRACTTSFGSAALAGFLLAVVHTLETIVKMTKQREHIIFKIIRCCAKCVLMIVRCFIEFVTRYALIYCAAFGVPFVEGCRRFVELMCTRYADVLLGPLTINATLTFNQFLFALVTAFAGFGVSYAAFKGTDGSDYVGLAIITCVCGALFSFAIFSVLSQPTLTGCDTLMVCFLEDPDRLSSYTKPLADTLNSAYREGLSSRISEAEARRQS